MPWAPLVLALALSAEAPPALVSPRALAPDYAYFATTLAEAEGAVREVVALGSALARTHNAWAERQTKTAPPCDDLDAASLAARAPVLGAAYRDAIQTARARASRLTRLVVSPVLTPLLGARDRDRADRVVRATRDHARGYLEASAWQSTHVAAWSVRCKPELRPVAGIVSRAPRTTAESDPATAVIGLGGGRVCPGGHPADGRAVVVAGASACYGPTRCDCTPVPVAPGAVLGP